MKREYLVPLVIGVLAALVGLGLGYYFFRPKDVMQEIIDSNTKIDSLNTLVDLYRDSIARVDADLETIVIEKIKWRTQYDTIIQYEKSDDIIHSLNETIKHGIQ